jgi:twitching motility protein PilI
MHYVQEASTIPLHRLTPIPNMPGCILGLMHRRSQVLWVVDLARFLGSTYSEASTQQYDIVILQVGQTTFAAAVHRIEGMAWLTTSQIQPPLPSIDPQLTHFVTGYVGQSLLILDAEAIAQSAMLQGHEI